MTSQPLLFLHILKTGGTSFWHYVDMGFNNDAAITGLSQEEDAQRQIERVKALTPEERDHIKVVFGHMAGMLKDLFPNGAFITIVRAPFERAISQYFYERKEAQALGLKKSERPLPSEVSADELWDTILKWGTNKNGGNFNLQTRTIAHFLDQDPSKVAIDQVPELVDQFEFMGIQENFSFSIFLLHELYGLPLLPVRLINAGMNGRRQYFPKWFVDEVNRLSRLDSRLYSLAHQRFDERASEVLGNSPDKFAKWDEYRRITNQLIDQPVSNSVMEMIKRMGLSAWRNG